MATPTRCEDLLAQGMNLQQGNELLAAKQKYQQILELEPNNIDANHLMGMLALQSKDYSTAEFYIKQAIKLSPKEASFYCNLGLVYYERKLLTEARKSWQEAITINPNYYQAYLYLAKSYLLAQENAEAQSYLTKLLMLHAVPLTVYQDICKLLFTNKQNEAAIPFLEKIHSLQPNAEEPLALLASCQFEAGDLEHALLNYGKALVINPYSAKTNNAYAAALQNTGNIEAAMRAFNIAKKIKYNGKRPDADKFPGLPLFRIEHDLLQLNYLSNNGIIDINDPEINAYRDTLTEIFNKHQKQHNKTSIIKLTASELQAMDYTTCKLLHIQDTPILPDGALNPELNIQEIETEYSKVSPSVIYIDNFLRPEALTMLQQYCLESTIWKVNYIDGFLGAIQHDAFSAPILAQICYELRTKFPNIFQQHLMYQSWGFKYNSALSGTKRHADFAAVNLNLWITPDTANLDPDSGGLVIWDSCAPSGWSFNDYNVNQDKIAEFLAKNNAQEITIPYKENRIAIFDSTLFHVTDKFKFKEGYENQRINLTFLYGKGLTPN